jgi:hypothetical protein
MATAANKVNGAAALASREKISSVTQNTQMASTAEEERLARIAMMTALAASTKAGESNRWVQFVATMLLAMITALASAFAVSVRYQERVDYLMKHNDDQDRKIEQQAEELREYEVWLQSTREKLSDKGWKLDSLPKTKR